MVIIIYTFLLVLFQRFCRNFMYIWLGSHSNPVAGCICWEADSVMVWWLGYLLWSILEINTQGRGRSWSVMPALRKFWKIPWALLEMEGDAEDLSWVEPRGLGSAHPWVRVLCVWWARDLRHGHSLQMSEATAEGNGNWRASTNCPPAAGWQSFMQEGLVVVPHTWLGVSFLN